MSGYNGNGELFLGSFKTIRAFRPNGKKSWKAITHDDTYSVGKEYVSLCRSWGWDIPTLMDILQIPKDQWSGTLITGVHYLGKTWEISITRKRLVVRVDEVRGFLYNPSTPVIQRRWVHEQSSYVVPDEQMQTCMTQHKETSPVSGCSCGFYSFYDIPTMLGKGSSYVSSPSTYHFGVIENYGKVIHCDLGLRSEKMKILGVVPWGKDGEEVNELIRQFPLDVFDASTS